MHTPTATTHRLPPHDLRTARLLALVALVLAVLALAPHAARAATDAYPADHTTFPQAQVNPVVAFDPAAGEHPKWVLLAIDPAFTQTVAFCRQFLLVADPAGRHWGCNAWANGASGASDTLHPLAWGRTYFWKVQSVDGQGANVDGPVRSFTIAGPAPTDPVPTVAEVSDDVQAGVYGASALGLVNTGTATASRSGVSGVGLVAHRDGARTWTLDVTYTGNVDWSRSFVKVTGTGGSVDYVKLRHVGTGHLRGTWTRTAAERKVTGARYVLQGSLLSLGNGATVRSAKRTVTP